MAKNYALVALKALYWTIAVYIALAILGLLLGIIWFFVPLFAFTGFVVVFLFIFGMMAQD